MDLALAVDSKCLYKSLLQKSSSVEGRDEDAPLGILFFNYGRTVASFSRL